TFILPLRLNGRWTLLVNDGKSAQEWRLLDPVRPNESHAKSLQPIRDILKEFHPEATLTYDALQIRDASATNTSAYYVGSVVKQLVSSVLQDKKLTVTAEKVDDLVAQTKQMPQILNANKTYQAYKKEGEAPISS